MPFPLSYQNELKINKSEIKNSTDYEQQFLSNLEKELKLVKASEIIRKDSQITFQGRVLRLGSNWNILTQIDEGKFQIISTNKQIIISYQISFKILLILSSLLVFIFGLAIFVPEKIPIPFAWKIGLVSIAWIWIFGMNWLIAIIRFPGFVERIAKEIEH